MTVHVLAHRGASAAEPENTIAAFRRAAEMGADAVELDVRRTVDEVLVVHHDAHLPDGRAIVATFAAELPASVATVTDALDACAGMWVNVEIKNDPRDPDFDPTDAVADATIALLADRGEPHRWLISSFRLETIDRCRALAPEIRTAWLTAALPDDVVATLVEHGHLALHPWYGTVTSELIEACHDVGIAVNTWTCDDPDAMRQLIGWGIDGICTNVPDVALAVLAESR
ncbi:MAG TPA: glycerophosphodiester phosphodiesterase, partial [Ilumatobacteraceae bacterium]|nr:glycerophosphodiester phosphodiesterase [Ilumatobacteraceae bacterium]